MEVPFEVVVHNWLLNIFPSEKTTLSDKNNILSLINDFEDWTWRHKKLNHFIWNEIWEAALSASERKAMINQPSTIISEASKKLRLTDKEADPWKWSEIAEIILYWIMKYYFWALPVVPKIFYKQNRQDNAKWADSVHITINETWDDFNLWLWEAKFYNSIENARLDSIISSVWDWLNTEKLRKENSIITSVWDIDELIHDQLLKDKIRSALSGSCSMDTIKPKLHIPILLLHECDITKGINEITDDYRSKIYEHHTERAKAYFTKQLAKLGTTVHLFETITFHLILLPVPDKSQIVETFIKKAEVHISE